MMKDSRVELFCPWVLHLSVKGNIDLDWGFHPVSVILLVLPTIQVRIFEVLTALSAQLSINTSPIIASDILGMKLWVSNNLEEILKARLGLLFAVIPIPFSQQK